MIKTKTKRMFKNKQIVNDIKYHSLDEWKESPDQTKFYKL